jgi:dipeptidyl aminopeptidase/acylaminoacyl peptidase
VRRLSAEDLFTLRFLRGASLSPDGRHVAYAVSCTDPDERFEIWIVGTAGGEARRIAYRGNAAAPRWSADGGSIAFVADQRLRVAAFPSLELSEPLTPGHLRVVGVPCWSPDSARLAVCLLERPVVTGPRRVTSKHFRADGLGFLEGLTQRLYEVDRASGAVRCLTPSETICSQPEWSPCGQRILLLATDNPIPFASYSPRLLTIEVAGGALTEVMAGDWYIACARWLPGGDHIAVVASGPTTLTIPTLSLWVVDRSGSEPQLRTPGWVGEIGFRIHHDMPAWDLTSDNLISILDRHTALATLQKGGSVEIWRIALAGDVAMERVLRGERACIVLDASAAADVLLFAVSTMRAPPDLCIARLTDLHERRLTGLNEHVLAQWPQTQVERFVFQSGDGLDIETWFMAPADRSGPLPTVLYIHAGPFNAVGHAFRFDSLLLASQGYGVLFANFRGSVGYGEPFMRAIMGDWGARGFPDHMGAVDAAIERGYANPDRLGVWGASHGGFATCWIVGHTRRFKAAIAEAAVTNFTTLYYLSDAPEVFARDLGGKPHEIPDVYRARSPITYAHRCTTPTMLLHGEDDLRCPISEAEQFYRILHDVGCTTELVRIPECSHLGDSAGPLSARRAQNEALVRWFQQHL